MINLSIKYYATEEYVNEAIANLDLSAGVMDSIDILNNVEPNKQLVTNGIGVLEWKDQPLCETNCAVVKLNSTNVRDLGEGATDGRYRYTFSLVNSGYDCSGSSIWDTSMYPWTIYFDGESVTIAERRMPVVLQNPTSKLKIMHMYNHGNDIRIEFQYDEDGEHIFIFQAGEMKYSQLSYNHMPNGYPKMIQNLSSFASYGTAGNLSADGQSYSYTVSKAIEENIKYRVRLKDADYFVTSVKNENGLITLGNATTPYSDPPFYAECDPAATQTIFYWNASYGQTRIGISKVEDVLVPMDEKFLPETVALKTDIEDAIANIDVGSGVSSWNDLEDKPFYKTESIVESSIWEIKGVETIDYGNGYAEGAISVFPDTYTYYDKKVIVEINGTAYSTSLTSSSYGAWFGDLTTLPFELYYGPYSKNLKTKVAGIYDVRLYIVDETLKTIDYEFLPAGYPIASYAQQNIADNVTVEGVKGYADLGFAAVFIEGQVYLVTYDGEVYERTCYSTGDGGLYIGDKSNGDEFCLEYWEGYTIGAYVINGVHTFSLSSIAESVVPMDEKYIPATIARHTDLEAAITSHNHIIDNITGLQAALDGKALQSDLVALANDFANKADKEHDHNDVYYTEAEIDTMLSEITSVERGGTGQTSIVDTTYVEPRYRASALVNTETTPTENGVITWVYE